VVCAVELCWKAQAFSCTVYVQFSTHQGPRELLLSTAGQAGASAKLLQESSPSDFFWARGIDGTGCNHLGRLLMQVREELLLQQSQSAPTQLLQAVS